VPLIVVMILSGYLGTVLGTRILDRLPEAFFSDRITCCGDRAGACFDCAGAAYFVLEGYLGAAKGCCFVTR